MGLQIKKNIGININKKSPTILIFILFFSPSVSLIVYLEVEVWLCLLSSEEVR